MFINYPLFRFEYLNYLSQYLIIACLKEMIHSMMVCFNVCYFFFQIKSCIKVLKEQEPGRVEGLLNALRYGQPNLCTTHKIFSNSIKREIHMGLPNQFHLSVINTSLNCLRYQCSNVFDSLKILERLQNELERIE